MAYIYLCPFCRRPLVDNHCDHCKKGFFHRTFAGRSVLVHDNVYYAALTDASVQPQLEWMEDDYKRVKELQSAVLPCPFCDAPATLFLGPKHVNRPYIACNGVEEFPGCGATLSGENLFDVLMKWNRRVSMDRLRREVSEKAERIRCMVADPYNQK